MQNLLVSTPTAERRAWAGLRIKGALLPPLATVILFALLQEALARSGLVNPRKFPPVSTVILTLGEQFTSGQLAGPLTQTLLTWMASLAISFLLALLIGFSLGLHPVVRALTNPVIEFIRPIPSTALIPLVLLTLGTNVEAALFLTCFGTVWQILPSIFHGMNQVGPMPRDTARAFRFTRWQTLRWITLPSMAPFLWTALRLGAAASLVLLISMELLAGINGVGHKISMAYAGGNTPVMYAYILVAALIGGSVNLFLTRFIAGRARLSTGGEA